jgi:hypothetical protein
MANTGLTGPYRLNFDTVSGVVTAQSPGIYALGHLDRHGRFCISNVGRSDEDLRGRLINCIGSEIMFKFEYASNAQAAFLRECELFHDFGSLQRGVHPARPHGTNLRCPRCLVFR